MSQHTIIRFMVSVLLLAFCTGIAPAETLRVAAENQTRVESPKAQGAVSGREIKSAVVHPFQSGNIPSEVSGVVAEFRYRAGDRVKKGDIVAVISPKRYVLAVKGAEQRVKADELSLKYADERVKATEALLSLDWTTTQKLIEAKEQAAICRARLDASRRFLEAAQLDAEACNVKAPFGGYLAVRYKEPFEATEKLEKLFLLIDTGKVYAVANVPENLLNEFGKKSRAVFTSGTGRKFEGTVDRVGKLINPESRTGRVWVLVDNPQGVLQVGMTGTLGFD
jgi:RND family efflux transporter MFP subunit